MKTIYLAFCLILYLIGSIPKLIKLHFLRKKGNRKEVDEYAYKCVTKFGRFITNVFGSQIVVKGEENLPEGNCVFIANHQSYVDIPSVLGYVKKPLGFIAKKELINIPFLSTWMKEIHCVFLDRKNMRTAVLSINDGIKNLKNGYSMLIFPEGTRSKGPKVGEFKRGSLKLAIKANVPIVPITLDGTYKSFEGNGNRAKAAKIVITISEPIYLDKISKEEKANLANHIREIIVSNLQS